jgi:hypothetical protein
VVHAGRTDADDEREDDASSVAADAAGDQVRRR